MSVLRFSKARGRFSLSRRRHGRLSEENACGNCSASRFPGKGGETRKNIPTKKLIVLQLQVTSAVRVAVCHPQDNVNIQLEVL